MSFIAGIIAIAVTTAAACAIVGPFLVLRRQGLLTEALSHSVLPGIVLGLVLFGGFGHPLLILAPAGVALIMVLFIDWLGNTRRLAAQAELGLVYPAMFSIGVIGLSTRFRGLPLSEHAILVGDINFAALTNEVVFGVELAPRAFLIMLAILTLNVLFVSIFFKELKLAIFDPELAEASGLSPKGLGTGLLLLVSTTIVGAFQAVGAVLVVALLVAPAATAILLSARLGRVIVYSVGIGIVGAVLGFWIAYELDSATSGTMTVVLGGFFLLAVLISPRRGVVARALAHRRRRIVFAENLLLLCLSNHETGAVCEGDPVDAISDHIGWDLRFARRIVRKCRSDGFVEQTANSVVLTERGGQRVHEWQRFLSKDLPGQGG